VPEVNTGIWQTSCITSDPEAEMLFLVILCVVLWLLGMVTTTTLGGALHILLVIAIVFLLIHVIQGRSISNI
jgi:hypothetical protein